MRGSRRNIRMVTDSKEFSATQDHTNLYSETDNRSGAHTIRTEKMIQDVTRGTQSQTKYRIEVREKAKRAII